MQARPAPLPRAVWIIALVSLSLHLLPRPGYEFHRDELLYLAMGDHLDFFRMQFPPLIAALAQFARLLPFDLLTAIHLLPALALVGIILLTANMTGMLGGGAHAQILAAMTKLSGAVFGLALIVAVLASPLRRDLTTRWPWLAVALALTLAAPSLLGQQFWGWPIFAQVQVLRDTQLGHVTPLGFTTGQLFLAGAAGPLLLIGALALWFNAALRPFRSLLVFALVAFGVLLVQHGKDYYFGPVHPALFAAGAVAAGQWLSSRRWAWIGAIVFLATGGLVLLPVGIPLLPPPQMITYAARLGLGRVVSTNYGTTLALPQDYADMTGWREQVDVVAQVCHALPRAEHDGAVIVGDNYGRTGAVALYGPALGLPYPISTHGDFYNWGPGERSGDVVIVIGDDAEDLGRLFGEVTLAARSRNPRGVDEEQDVPIFVCRHPKQPLQVFWHSLGVDWG